MARPVKHGLDYFPLDTDAFYDIKVRKLVRGCGGGAFTVYAFVLCLIYRSGYYMEWDEESSFVVAEATGYGENYVKKVMGRCLALGLFSEALFRQHGVLSSEGIQKRYRNVVRLCRRIGTIDEFNLLADTEEGVAPETTEVSSEESAENRAVMPQRKVKERKEKQKKENRLSLDGNAAEGNAGGRLVPVGRMAEWLKSDSVWLESVAGDMGMEAGRMAGYMDAFVGGLAAAGVACEAEEACRRHFVEWLRKRLQYGKIGNFRSEEGGGVNERLARECRERVAQRLGRASGAVGNKRGGFPF